MITRHQLSVGTLVLLLFYVGIIQQPMSTLATSRLDIARSMAAMERVFEVLEFEPGLTNRKGTPLTGEMHRADAFIASDRWIVGWSEPNTSMKPGDPGPGEVLRDEFCLRGDFGRGYKLFLRCVAKTPDS